MNEYKKIALLACWLVGMAQVHAQFRKYSNEFLNIGAGARGLGMGAAQVASVQDATAGYWNPAGLVQVQQHMQLTAMHADYFAGIGKYDFVALAIPTKSNNRTLGISFLRFAIDDIPNTLFLVEPDGSVNYNNITSFSSADYAFLLSYSQQIKNSSHQKLSIGGNAKIIYRKVGSFASAIGFGIDAALQYQHNDWLAGIVLKDATSTFNAWTFTFTDREKEILYLTQNNIPLKSTENTAPRLVLAGAKKVKLSSTWQLLAEANLSCTFDGKRNTLLRTSLVSVDPNVGVEISRKNSLFFRGGISNFQKALSDADLSNQKTVWIFQPSLGAGFKTGNVAIDYAFTNLANQSSPLYTHIFSLKMDLIKKTK